MARRSSFQSTLNAIARDAARRQRQAETERKRQARALEREQIRLARETEKSEKLSAKEAQQRQLELLQETVHDQNVQLEEQIEDLRSLLDHTLEHDDAIDLESIRPNIDTPTYSPPVELTEPAPEPLRDPYFADVIKPGRFSGMLGKTRIAYEKLISERQAQYDKDFADWQANEIARKEQLETYRTEYHARLRSAEEENQRRNQEIDELIQAYEESDPLAIIAYCSMVLERSSYPEGFPQEFRVPYTPESKELVIEYELPTSKVIPDVGAYRFVKSKASIETTTRKVSEIRELYQDIVAAVALRSIHEIYEADRPGYIEVVTFNGFASTVDPSTGKDIRPYLISVRTTRQRFLELDLARIEKKACLRNLGAQVSPRPAEMQAVKPIVDFNMVDKRFVEASDVLSDLESRPNLMELNPFEFENLVSNLFGLMGLDTKLTRSSRDGGVDCVAFDPRPVLGGKVVIQAKRYRNTVGVSAVRDLYGTMMNEGANKGILVTTSGYGPDAYDFCKDKPVELIDGGGLLYLLEQNGIPARIVFPDNA